MKHIRCWEDLRQFGIYHLSGEACTVGLRSLCDLTADAVALIRHIFGLPDMDWQMENQTRTLDQIGHELLGDTAERIRTRVRQFDKAMNGGDAVASIMLPRCMFRDIAVMACLMRGCEVAVELDDGAVYGIEPGDVAQYHLDSYYDTALKQEVKSDDKLMRLKKYHGVKATFGKLKGQPAVGINAVSAFTGMAAGCNG